MINVLAVYIGNDEESYAETRIQPGMNILFSTKNNVGKTIVMQSIMYVCGATPTFTSDFNHRNYSYILDLDVDGNPVSIVRNQNMYIVKDSQGTKLYESVYEFQQYWDQHIRKLPVIVVNGHETQVGLELFTQLAFIAQDGRSSSKINAGRFNRNDFIEMVYAMADLDARTLDKKGIVKLKARRDELVGRRRGLLKQVEAIQLRGTGLPYVSPTVDRAEREALLVELNEVKDAITELRKKRNRTYARQVKNETALAEIRSLNNEIGAGSVICMDCGSENIGYKVAGSDYVFDITTPDVRNEIQRSIQDRIDGYASEVKRIEEELVPLQEHLETLLVEKQVTLADIVAYQDDYRDEQDIDRDITAIDAELEQIRESLESNRQIETDLKDARKAFREKLLQTMDSARHAISPDQERTPYDGLFTKSSNVFSGSDETEYFLSREYALACCLEHGLPLIVDSFRAEDLSTEREENALELMSKLGNQIILTTTIKREEGPVKYTGMQSINAIDYSGNAVNKLLSPAYNELFETKLAELGVTLATVTHQ